MNFDLKILNDRTPKTGDNGNVNNQQRSQQQPNGNEIDLDRIVRQFDERASIYEDAIALSNFTNTPTTLPNVIFNNVQFTPANAEPKIPINMNK